MSLERYFTNFEFYWDRQELGMSLQTKRKIWTLAVYILLSLGIFSRQITAFPQVQMAYENISWSTFSASLIIGGALVPPVMRWISRKVKEPNWEHAISAFSIGFFVDLSSKLLVDKVFSTLIR